MSKIPDDILEALICTECACYLSYGPIRLKVEGGPVCGRCLLPDNSYVTDIPYENLAKMMNFPCRYKKYGCKHEEKFGEVKTHEDNCEYKEYFCPVISDGSCKWIGSVKQILEHVENDHNDKLLEHPCVVPHSFTENQTNIYITSIYGFLFLIHLEFLISTRKIRHWVRILAGEDYAQRFEFNLNIESPSRKHIMQNETVLPFENESEVALVTSVNVLKDFFESLEDIKFVVTINLLGNQTCSTCKGFIKKFLYQSGDQYKCENCLPALKMCGNCKHKDIETKGDKHRTYFCIGHTCMICPVSLFGTSNYVNQQEHIKHQHPNFYHNSNAFKTIIVSENGVHVINTKIGQILCELLTFSSSCSLYINIYAPLPDNELNNYNCYLEIKNTENNYMFEGFLHRENGLNSDWTLKITNLKESDLKTEIEIKVTFSKRDIYKHPQLLEKRDFVRE